MPVSVSLDTVKTEKKYWSWAWYLSIGTILYNVVEGTISIWFGVDDEALTLFGFGIDSVIEVISAIGVAHMVWRLKRQGSERRDTFERTSLRVTGTSFYGLTAVLLVTAVASIIVGHVPENTISGVVISVISISFMWLLIKGKINVGTRLKCSPIIADANCGKVCLRMSLVLLVSSLLYELFKISYIDAAGAVVLAWYSFKEGRECFQKAQGVECCDTCGPSQV